jgi:hypothetical protein
VEAIISFGGLAASLRQLLPWPSAFVALQVGIQLLFQILDELRRAKRQPASLVSPESVCFLISDSRAGEQCSGPDVIKYSSRYQLILLAEDAGSSAAPQIILRPHGQTGPDRVQLDVTHRVKQIRLVHRIGEKSSLPQMPGPTLALVDSGGVAAVSLTDSLPEALDCGGHKNQMNVVGHEAISPDFNAGNMAHFPEQGSVEHEVLVPEKSRLPSVPALRNVMWNTGRNHPRDSHHRQAYRTNSCFCQIRMRLSGISTCENSKNAGFEKTGDTLLCARCPRFSPLRKVSPVYILGIFAIDSLIFSSG